MTHEAMPAYCLWGLVIINTAVFVIFAFSFTRPAGTGVIPPVAAWEDGGQTVVRLIPESAARMTSLGLCLDRPWGRGWSYHEGRRTFGPTRERPGQWSTSHRLIHGLPPRERVVRPAAGRNVFQGENKLRLCLPVTRRFRRTNRVAPRPDGIPRSSPISQAMRRPQELPRYHAARERVGPSNNEKESFLTVKLS